MRAIFKILLFPLIVVLTVLILFLRFLLGVGTFLLNIISVIFVLLALIAFFKGEKGYILQFIIAAFLFSPYGLPMIGSFVVEFIESFNDILKSI